MWASKNCGVFQLSFVIILGLGLIACSEEKPITGNCNKRVSPYFAGTPETAICTTNYSWASTVNITFNGYFQKRLMSGAGLGNASTPIPIQYAEVRVFDNNNILVQCGALNSSGIATLQVPTSTSNYSVKIFSRADNSFVKASVLNCPEENVPHSVSATFTPDVDKSLSITAGVTGSTPGEVPSGAFNILNEILLANSFLKTKVGSCSGFNCQPFSVAPKVSAYWSAGFNPNVYQNAPSSGISFYLPGYRRLFILGGIDGDTDTTDTDHFDDSVILHEYGHFLEDVYSNTDSPGGKHTGNSMIDPRLAWSEAWGNFIQAAIRGEAKYRDSSGNIDGTSFLFFDVPLETPNAGCAPNDGVSGCDIPSDPYEGNFREFAITRYLWDLFDSGGLDTDSDGVNDVFVDIWKVLTSNLGLKNGAQAFRNIGLINEIQRDDLGGISLSSAQAIPENLTGDTLEYARFVASGTSCSYSMTPLWDPSEDSGSFATSNLVRNNDFYFIKHPGGSFNLTLTYNTPDTGAGEERESDLDLYIYNENGRYGEPQDMVAKSETYFDNNQLTPGTETISKYLPAGNYLINIHIYTGGYDPVGCIGNAPVQVCNGERVQAGDPLTYTLTYNGGPLCPAPRP